MEIGAQLYTVREFCKTPEDLEKTLSKISEIGYRNVQIAGTCEYDAKWLNEVLKKNGLKCVLTHTRTPKFMENLDKVLQDHETLSCDRIGLGVYRFNETSEPFERFFQIYEPIVNILAKSKKYFMFHNHAAEFQKKEGKLILDHLAERFSPDHFGFTLDLYWVQMGGGDPAFWLEKLAGRVPCIHLKDFAFGQKMAVIGEGNLNWDRIFEKASLAGTEYMLVEQDNCYGEDPFDCLKRSFEFLRSRGF